jgi:hypothetical protein
MNTRGLVTQKAVSEGERHGKRWGVYRIPVKGLEISAKHCVREGKR